MATKAPAKNAAKKTGTAVAIKKPSGGAIVDIKAQMAADLAALSNRTAPAGGDKIQLKNKKFVLPSGDSTDVLQAVIVEFVSVNNFYEGTYDPKAISPPACFAIGTIPTQLVPSPNAPAIQSDSCAGCPMNQYGSASVGEGKACKNQRRLALLPPGGTADDAIMVLDVSPTGLKSFDSYVRSVAQKFGVTPVGVVTEISFDPNVDYASLRFGNPEPNESLAEHYGRRTEAMERITQEPDVSSYSTPQPPKPKARVAKPAARR